MNIETKQDNTKTDIVSAGQVERCVMWIITKWDWIIYRLAYGSMRRMCKREPAFALILERWIQEWRKQNPMPPHLEESANRFFESCRGHNYDGTC